VSEPWQHFYQSQRLRLSYWVWGSAEKPPLIFVHGFRDHSRSWDRYAEAFLDDYRVITPDLRGHGDSEWAKGASYGLVDFVPDLVSLIDLVGGRASVVAHSLGGSATLIAAGAYPDRFERIVCIEGAGAMMHEPSAKTVTAEWLHKWVDRARGNERREPRVYPTFERCVERVMEANKRLSRPLAEHLARWAARPIDGGYVWKYDPMALNRPATEIRHSEIADVWARIECPVLHLIGAESALGRGLFHGEPVASFFKDARTETLADANHWVHHDQFDRTLELMRDFLLPAPATPARNEE